MKYPENKLNKLVQKINDLDESLKKTRESLVHSKNIIFDINRENFELRQLSFFDSDYENNDWYDHLDARLDQIETLLKNSIKSIEKTLAGEVYLKKQCCQCKTFVNDFIEEEGKVYCTKCYKIITENKVKNVRRETKELEQNGN